MTLTDTDIRKAIDNGEFELNPYDPEDKDIIGPASIDLRLAHTFLVMTNGQKEVHRMMQLRNGQISKQDAIQRIAIDPRVDTAEEVFTRHEVPEGEAFVLMPGQFLLGSTLENITLDPSLCGKVEGRSSYGRLGIAIHITAGFIDPGFSGTITLEICNHSPRPVLMFPGERVCQLVLSRAKNPAESPYGSSERSKYQGQKDPTPSRLHQELVSPEPPEIEQEDEDKITSIIT